MQRQTMAKLAESYVAQRTRRGFSVGTLRSEGATINRFAKWWDLGRKVPKSLRDTDLEDYLYGPDGVASKVQPSTFNTYVSQLSQFLRWSARRGELRADVLDSVFPVSADPKEFVRLSMAQIVYMIESCDDEWERWVLTLASQTLGRDGELRRLRLRDFNLDVGVLNYYRPKTKDPDEMPITAPLETGYRRWVTFVAEHSGSEFSRDWYAVCYRARPRGAEWLYDPSKMRTAGLSAHVQKHAARVLQADAESLKGQGVHLVRRSMARAFYDRLSAEKHADPLRVVMAALGHARSSTTERYLGIRADRLRRNELLSASNLLWTSDDNVVKPAQWQEKKSG